MVDDRFFSRSDSVALGALISVISAATPVEPAPDADTNLEICDVAPLGAAGKGDISFLDNPKYAGALAETKAQAVLVRGRDLEKVPTGCTAIVAKDPYRAFALISRRFYPEADVDGIIDDRAAIDPFARLEAGVSIAAGCWIGLGVEIGAGTRIGPNTVIGARCRIGRDCRIGPNVSVSHALIGDRVGLFAGVTIGEAGFGYAMGAGGHVPVPQLGRVIIQDDVDIGANSAIDRGAGPDTVVGEGTKIDNQVQIGHNVQIGRHCVLAGQVGIAGSAVLEDFVVLGGKAGIAGHLRIGAGAQVAGGSIVMRDIPPGARQCGAPARDIRGFFKEQAMLTKLAKGEDSAK